MTLRRQAVDLLVGALLLRHGGGGGQPFPLQPGQGRIDRAEARLVQMPEETVLEYLLDFVAAGGAEAERAQAQGLGIHGPLFAGEIYLIEILQGDIYQTNITANK